MVKHVKPTQEELKAKIKATEKELEGLENPPTNPPVEPPKDPPVDPVKKGEDPSADPPEGPPADPLVDSKSQKKIKKLQKELENQKKRYTDSQREGQKNFYEKTQGDNAIDKAVAVGAPTEEEMRAQYPEWDDMDDVQKRNAIGVVKGQKQMEILAKGRQKTRKLQVWYKKVDKYVADPQTLIDNPDLEGLEQEFRIFASTPKRSRSELGDLVSSFLHQQGGKPKPKKKGKMFPTGTGGPSTPPKKKTGKLTIEQGAALKKSNYKKYSRKLKAGLIETI